MKLYIIGTDTTISITAPIIYLLSIPAVINISAVAIIKAIAVPKSGCFIINNTGKPNIANKINNLVGLFISLFPLLWIFVIASVKNKITNIFANSPGWNEKNPISNQLVAPFIGFVNNTPNNKK